MSGRLRAKARASLLFLFGTFALSMFAVSCSRPGLRPEDSAQADQRQAPFQNTASASSVSTPALASIDSTKAIKAESALPFRDGQNLPAGTLVTVRLKGPISSEYPGESLTFAAVVDEPVQSEGDVVLAAGAGVAGRVESMRTSQVKRNGGYIRLTLDAIDFDGRRLPVQTSSLFVHGNPMRASNQNPDSSPQAVHLETGRRLTFRLIEPVSILPVQASGH